LRSAVDSSPPVERRAARRRHPLAAWGERWCRSSRRRRHLALGSNG